MNKAFRITLVTLMFLSFIAVGSASADGSLPNGTHWYLPGNQVGASLVEYTESFDSMYSMTINGITYSPRYYLTLFAGDAVEVTLGAGTSLPAQLCVIYPKALWPSVGSAGIWYPQIFRADAGVLVGFPTTIQYLSEYPGIPFACTNTSVDGTYFIVDFWGNP